MACMKSSAAMLPFNLGGGTFDISVLKLHFHERRRHLSGLSPTATRTWAATISTSLQAFVHERIPRGTSLGFFTTHSEIAQELRKSSSTSTSASESESATLRFSLPRRGFRAGIRARRL